MPWRMAITHVTRYRYAGPVATSYNEARLTPLTTPSQTTVDSRVEVLPAAHVSRYWDYWGTLVHAFDVHVPHSDMVVTGRSVVERSNGLHHTTTDAGWGDIDRRDLRDRLCEYLSASRYVPDEPALVKVGRQARADSATPAEAVHAVIEWVRSQLAYEQGSTTTHTSAVEAWAAGRGVCQDFVHLSLAVLRAAGVPARYVSGYLHPHRMPEIGVTARGESHAWVEAWVGDWVGVDPTNLVPIEERHVIVARGRDYGDVPPLKGIYNGGPAAESTVEVDVTRLA